MKVQITLLFLLLSFTGSINAQVQEEAYRKEATNLPDWVQLMYQDQAKVELVIDAYEAYYQTHPFVKNGHTQYYKRWLRSISRDVNGLMTNPELISVDRVKENETKYTERSLEVRELRGPNSQWQSLGPYDFDKEAAGVSYAAGAAHVYTVERAATDTDVLYAGTATAGVWKTTNKGSNWTLVTPDLIVNSVRSLEVDYTDDKVVYFEGSGSVYKTTDGGITWNVIGDAAFTALSHSVNDIVTDPTSHTTLMLSSNQGLYRTTNGGANWSLIMAGAFQEIEYHPTIPTIVYAIKQTNNVTEFYKSTDGGLNFTIRTNGWPNPTSPEEQKRTEIAVSPDAPNRIYALATGAANGGSGLYGVYTSNDSGESWTRSCCGPQPAGVPDATTNPNLMGWSDVGADDGGQYYYDLALGVSATDADSIYVAGVNLWYSGDGGNTFVCPSKWSHSYKPNYVHADIHDIKIYGNELWVACDGGLFFSTNNGATVDRKMYGIQGTDFWGFGTGFWDGEVMLGGTYHNGTLLKDNEVYLNGWLSTDGGDNIRGFVNYGKDRIVYSDYNKKLLPGDRTTAITTYGFDKKPNASYIIGESSQLEFDPRCFNIMYSGVDNELWKTEDDGASFDLLYTFADKVTSIEVAWTDPNRIYAATWGSYWGANKKMWRSNDAGLSWTEITPISSNSWVAYDITISSTDANTLWAARVHQSTYYGPDNGNKVYKSTDGGSTWTNITTSDLDGEYLTNIEHQRGSNGGVYVATRRAVYYRNDAMSDWELFNNNLPLSTFSTQLVPYYREAKLRNGTNRGVYECDFYENSAPSAQISANKLSSFCTRDVIQYMDHSALSENSASWQWQFPGGTPSSSTLRNPQITYDSPGSYDVTLTVTDAYGSDSQTLSDFIEITSECEVDTIPGNAVELTNSGDYVTVPDLGMNTNELSFSAWIKPDGIQPDYTGIIMTGSGSAAGLNLGPNNVLAYHWPGGEWWWNSGLTVPSGAWSHVALVVTENAITVYLNGVGSTHNVNPSLVDFSVNTLIGSYQAWGSRNFKGMIDEVGIWNKAISQTEVRELRHLTKKPTDDPSLVAYYQFNRSSGVVTDRVGTRHATMAGAAARTTSTAPVGGGASATINVTTGGAKSFAGTGLTLDFPSVGTYPNGEVVATRINLTPDQRPDGNNISRSYWVVNNYGTNASFSTLESISFDGVGIVNPIDVIEPVAFALYKRTSNADGSSWGDYIDLGDAAVAGTDGSVSFSTGNGINSFSQFVITNLTNLSLPVELLSFTASLRKDKTVDLEWKTASEKDNDFFVVERSRDGQNFEYLHQENSQGNATATQNYSWTDRAPYQGVSYYRLKIVALDGTEAYSEVVSITINALAEDFVVFPNPINKTNLLQVRSNIGSTFDFSLFDSAGKLVKFIKDTRDFELSLKHFTDGVYFYQIKTANKIQNGNLVIH